MPKRNPFSAWTKLARRTLAPALKVRSRPVSRVEGDWIAGMALGAAGARRYRLYRPPDAKASEKLPLMVMLHGCGQDADTFAASTRMNRIARQHRFLVLYPEQDRLRNVHGCWICYETRIGSARAEMSLILNAINQACTLYGADRQRIALAGLSAGASMAALLATHEPERFKAVIMHSGIPPGTASSTASAVQAMRGRRGSAPLAATAADMKASWPALMVIHGGRDSVVASGNAQAAVAMWSGAAQARAGAPRTLQRGKRYAMDVTDHVVGRRVVTTFVEIASLGHAWSGGTKGQPYSDPLGPDASRLAWAFAARQFEK
jgi:poly(hydroxyalkanoate) depolymerase family esterase